MVALGGALAAFWALPFSGNVFVEGWEPEKFPARERTQDQFLTHVTEAFLFDVDAHARLIATAVFRVIDRHVSAGEVTQVRQTLPSRIRELWP